VIVLVDIVLRGAGPFDERPPVGARVEVELRDTTTVDDDAVRLAAKTTTVEGEASAWLATTELQVDHDIVRSADLTVWVRVVTTEDDESEDDESAGVRSGDWITVQSVPVSPTLHDQRVTAPVVRI
jgi:hypothetical protein